MTDFYTMLGIALGLISILALYVSNRIQQRRQVHPSPNSQGLNLKNGILIFLAGATIAAGVKVCIFALDPTVFPANGGDRTYVFLGGLSVVWVSIETIWELLTKRP